MLLERSLQYGERQVAVFGDIGLRTGKCDLRLRRDCGGPHRRHIRHTATTVEWDRKGPHRTRQG